MEELNDLLGRGCEWLNDYLVINPKELEKLEVCQTPENKKAAAPYLVKAGEEAKTGDVDKAIATFKTALKWNPELKFDSQKKARKLWNKVKARRLVSEGEQIAREGDFETAVIKFQEALKLDPSLEIKPQQNAQKLAAQGLVSKANELVKEKKIKEAIEVYKKAQQLDTTVEIDAHDWNILCWRGSLNGFAKEVMFACEKAVKLVPDNEGIRDSRGLARALTGDDKGAIADFEVYIAKNNNQEHKTKRQKWVKALQEDKNPFTEEELEKLQDE